MSIPIIGRPQGEPQLSRAGDPILLRQGALGGTGPNIVLQQRTGDQGGTFAAEEAVTQDADVAMATEVAKVLHQHYRGYPWQVIVSSFQGVCIIKIPTLMDKGWACVLPLNRVDLTPANVVRHGGELLERLNLRRGAMDPSQYQEVRRIRDQAPNLEPGTLPEKKTLSFEKMKDRVQAIEALANEFDSADADAA